MEEQRKPIKPKADFTLFHKVSLIVSVLVIWIPFIMNTNNHVSQSKLIATIGYQLDIFGVIIASIKPKYYGSFYDGGKIEFDRQKVESNFFQVGMFFVGIGLLFQSISTSIQ